MNNKIKNMKNHKSQITNRKYRGFSLVELLVVITIIAILSVVAYMAMGGQTIKARDSKRLQDLSTIQSALELYFVEYSRYPAVLENGEATVVGGWKIPKKYLSEIPKDPSTSAHAYSYFLSGSTYQIGATLEKDGTSLTARIVGNSDANLISGKQTSDCSTACGTTIADGSTTCVPYCP
jgi:general secretion pathway protein G